MMAKESVIQRSKETLGGTPVFNGTRVPVKTLIDYLEAGDRLDDFLLRCFPDNLIWRSELEGWGELR